jgi:hypothetical protein
LFGLRIVRKCTLCHSAEFFNIKVLVYMYTGPLIAMLLKCLLLTSAVIHLSVTKITKILTIFIGKIYHHFSFRVLVELNPFAVS